MTRRSDLGVQCASRAGRPAGKLAGRMPERSIGADCKSAGLTPYEGSNPSPTTTKPLISRCLRSTSIFHASSRGNHSSGRQAGTFRHMGGTRNSSRNNLSSMVLRSRPPLREGTRLGRLPGTHPSSRSLLVNSSTGGPWRSPLGRGPRCAFEISFGLCPNAPFSALDSKLNNI